MKVLVFVEPACRVSYRVPTVFTRFDIKHIEQPTYFNNLALRPAGTTFSPLLGPSF